MSPPIYKNNHYEVVITQFPETLVSCYGVVNNLYGITEAYISQLAEAIVVAGEFDEELSTVMNRSPHSGAASQARAN